MRKKLLHFLLIVSVIVIVPIISTAETTVALANSNTNAGNFIINDGVVIEYIGDDADVIIPSEVNGEIITKIQYSAFEECSTIKSVTIPDSIVEIGYNAFAFCENLETVHIGTGLTDVDGSCFCYCDSLLEIYVDSNNSFLMSENGILYSKDKTALIKYPTSSKNKTFQIPNTVTQISSFAFANCTALEEVVIPSSVTHIEDVAFYYCINLDNIQLPDSIEYIGSYAFEETAYYNDKSNWDNETLYIGNFLIKSYTTGDYTIKDGTVFVCGSSFENCTDLTSIILPNSVRVIGDWAFSECNNLKEITIGEKVDTIGYSPFENCQSLEKVYWNAIEITQGDEFSSCQGMFSFNAENVGIDGSGIEIIFGDSVEVIPDHLFDSSDVLKSVIIGKNVKETGQSTFSNCPNLQSIKWNAIAAINENSWYSSFEFSGSENGIKLEIGNDVKEIPKDAFLELNLKDFTIPQSVIKIGDSAFGNVQANITMSGNMLDIGDYAFSNCSSLNINNIEIKSVGAYAFSDTLGLSDVTISDETLEVPEYAFWNCSRLKKITIGSNINIIGENAFAMCTDVEEVLWKAKNVEVNNSIFANLGTNATGVKFVFSNDVKKVPDDIFSQHYNFDGTYYYDAVANIASIEIGENITEIGYLGDNSSVEALNNKLTKVYWNTNNDIDSSVFAYDNTELIIGNMVDEIPNGAQYYKTVTVGTGVTQIRENEFYLGDLEKIYLPNSIIYIGDSAFAESNITDVIIPDSVTNIGNYAFFDCSKLTSVKMSDNVTHIGEAAFASCTALKDVEFGIALTNISESLFAGCTSLTSVNIPNAVTSIGASAFGGCSALAKVTIGNGVANIGESSFYGCTSLADVNIGKGINTIENYAFAHCSALTSITIPDSVENIGEGSFCGCNELISITLPFVGSSRAVSGTHDAVFGYIFGYTNYDNVEGTIYQGYFNKVAMDVPYYYYIPDGITNVTLTDTQNIPYHAFYNCETIETITIPDSVTNIGKYAFEYCSGLTDIYYTGNEENWKKINIDYTNEVLTTSTIHYNSSIPDVEPLPQEGEIKKSIGIFKSYHEDDNRVWIDELGDFSLVSTRYVTDETDVEFLDNLDSIIDEYVLVEENVYWEHGAYYGDILSVQPVNTIVGKLSSVANNTIVIDGKSYNIDKEFSQTAKLSLNKYVMIHILNDKIVGITQLYNKKGILTEYREADGILVIDGGEYSISSAADMSSISNINNMIGKKIGFYLDDEWDWNIVRISSHETVTGELWFYSKTQNEVSVGDKTYCINTDEYTFDEELLGKRVFCLVEDDFIIHMDSIYKLMPRLLISISSPELSYDNGFENSSFSVNAELRNGWNYDLPQMYNEDIILEDEFFKTLPTTNITLGDMTWNVNENIEYTLSDSNCGGVVIPFKGSHQMTLEGKIKDSYVPPEYKINLTSEFCVQAQEPRMTRTLTDTHNLRITNLGKKPLVAEPFVSNNTPLQNVYLYANQLNENLNDYLEEIKNTPDKVMASDEQLETIARKLMEEDDNSSSKRINGLDGIIGMPEADRVYAYMALAQYLEGYVNEGKNLGKIDVSADVISVAASIVSAVRSNMDWTQFSCEYGGYAIDINMLNVYGAGYGTITLQKGNSKTYTGAIISTNAEIASAMESYLNQVKELGLNATNEILYSYAGELAKLTGFADIEKSAIKKVVDRKLNKVFKDSGFGDVASILKNCYDCFDQIRDVLKCTTPDDLVGTLSDTENLIKKLEKLDFEKYDISEGVTSKIVDKINDSRKALVAALNDYLVDEGTDSSGHFFDSFIKHIIECPVDFTVYDENNNEVGYVRNGLIYYEDSIHIETKGDVKYVYIPKDKDYRIELEATDDGEFTYVVEDVNNGNVSGRLNFYQIPITAGNTFIPEIQTNALTGNNNEVYLNSNNGIIKADEYISGDSEKVLVEIGYVGNGTVVGGGAYTKGDSVTLSATANEGYSFKGWYNEDGIVSNECIYRFPAISDVEIYAKFERANIVDSRFTINIDEDYADKMYVKAYKNDGITNNISVNMFDFSNISAELDLKCVLYDNDKAIDEIIQEAKFDRSCGGYIIDSVDLSRCDIMEIYDSSNNLIATLVNNDTGEIRTLDSLENSLIVNADYVGVDLDVYNQSASQQTLRAYLGIYDNDNRLIDLLSSDSIILESNTSNNLNIDKEIDIKNADSTYHIKLFVWKDGNSLMPLSKTQEVIVNE